jgi:O-succinylbenzoic acid--CoA ligase
MSPDYDFVHPQFKLNGFHLDKDDLSRIAYSFIKEGEDFERSVGHFLLDWFDKYPTIEITTSGTTGKPKTISVSKKAMVNSALATGEFFDLYPGDRALHCLPTKYIAGKMMFVRAFILGLDMDLVAPSSHPMLNNEAKYDFVAMVPLQAQHSMAQLRQIKKLIIGGVRINSKLERQLMELPTEIYETYGMTETITHIAAKRVGADAFTVLPHVTISYNDKECLVIHAPRISDDVIETNDLVRLVSENQFVFLGRIDNIVNSGGIKLIPEQIEQKLATAIDRRFFVCGLPDEALGEKLALVIEGDRYELEPSVFSILDRYEKPKEVLFIPKFSETGSGKVIRKDTLLVLK